MLLAVIGLSWSRPAVSELSACRTWISGACREAERPALCRGVCQEVAVGACPLQEWAYRGCCCGLLLLLLLLQVTTSDYGAEASGHTLHTSTQ